jgi:hypothetical protein
MKLESEKDISSARRPPRKRPHLQLSDRVINQLLEEQFTQVGAQKKRRLNPLSPRSCPPPPPPSPQPIEFVNVHKLVCYSDSEEEDEDSAGNKENDSGNATMMECEVIDLTSQNIFKEEITAVDSGETVIYTITEIEEEYDILDRAETNFIVDEVFAEFAQVSDERPDSSSESFISASSTSPRASVVTDDEPSDDDEGPRTYKPRSIPTRVSVATDDETSDDDEGPQSIAPRFDFARVIVVTDDDSPCTSSSLLSAPGGSKQPVVLSSYDTDRRRGFNPRAELTSDEENNISDGEEENFYEIPSAPETSDDSEEDDETEDDAVSQEIFSNSSGDGSEDEPAMISKWEGFDPRARNMTEGEISAALYKGEIRPPFMADFMVEHRRDRNARGFKVGKFPTKRKRTARAKKSRGKAVRKPKKFTNRYAKVLRDQLETLMLIRVRDRVAEHDTRGWGKPHTASALEFNELVKFGHRLYVTGHKAHAGPGYGPARFSSNHIISNVGKVDKNNKSTRAGFEDISAVPTYHITVALFHSREDAKDLHKFIDRGGCERADLHCSHLCNCSYCISPFHILKETANNNVQRQKCGSGYNGVCIENQHDGPPCILGDKLSRSKLKRLVNNKAPIVTFEQRIGQKDVIDYRKKRAAELAKEAYDYFTIEAA